ncbi:Universal stress protein E [Planctomycetes bacterium Poly30]|uniref:Universal stress protein E n=1 Tax=Saltatorellus ferox TaxID=2528018 RepID=A0A518ER20_9BACT|nr:Universal stress protein E [Planctomycetes bacterium Poly30]
MSPSIFPQAVVGDDGRIGGDCALAAAAFLHQRLGTKTHVVHSIDLPMAHSGSHPEEVATMRAEVAGRAETWLTDRVKSKVGDGATCQVKLGRPSEALLRAARSLPADLMVVGPHEKSGFIDFGGTQRSVFGNQVAHVWSQPKPDVSVQRILVPFAFDEKSEAAIAMGLRLAGALSVPLIVIHCSEAIGFVDPMPAYAGDAGMPVYVIDAIHDAAKKRFESWFESYAWGDADVESRFIMGSPSLAIIEEQRPSDLMVMGTNGHTGVAAAFLGGVTYSVLKEHKGPILAMIQ